MRELFHSIASADYLCLSERLNIGYDLSYIRKKVKRYLFRQEDNFFLTIIKTEVSAVPVF